MPKLATDQLHITAVVVTYNRPNELRQVINGLLQQSRVLQRILVIDNASNIPAVDSLEQFKNDIEIIRTEQNLGGAGGFAKGLELANNTHTDWIWLMDDDAIPYPDALTQLTTHLLPNNNIGVLCCEVEELNKIANTHQRTFNPYWGTETKITLSAHKKHPSINIDTASFVGFLISVSVINTVGYPNAQMFLAYDDTEYSLRIKKNGFSIQLIPNSKIKHLRTPEAKLSSSKFGLKHYFNIRNRLYTIRKYAHFQFIAGLIGTIYAVLLWVIAPKNSLWGSFLLLNKAIVDGWKANLTTPTL